MATQMELSPADFSTRSAMLTAFVRESALTPQELLPYLAQQRTVYDGDFISLDLPADVPAEVPSVILGSAEGDRRLELSRARIVIRSFAREYESFDVKQAYETFWKECSAIAKEARVDVSRLGAVVTRFSAFDEPGRILSRSVCRDAMLEGPLNRPEGFELHAHKTFSMTDRFTVNSWMRLKTAKQGGSHAYDAILVEQDINTLAEEAVTRDLIAEEIHEFCSAVAHEFDVVLETYVQAAAKGVRE